MRLSTARNLDAFRITGRHILNRKADGNRFGVSRLNCEPRQICGSLFDTAVRIGIEIDLDNLFSASFLHPYPELRSPHSISPHLLNHCWAYL